MKSDADGGGPNRDGLRWEAVLNAALEVFQRNGYHRASVADVAAAAGLAKPTLYHYINSKEDLLEAIIRRSFERLASRLAELESRDRALDMVWQIINTHVLFNIEFRAETTVFLSDFEKLSKPRQDAITEMLDDYDRNLQALVVEAQRRGEADAGLDSRLAVLSMLGAANSVARWYHPRPGSDPREIASAFADMAAYGLVGQPQPDRRSGASS